MVSSSTAVEGVNIARSNTSQSVSSRPVLGRRPAWLKNRRRANTRNPSAVSSMQRNVTAIDKKNSSPDSVIRHLGTVGRGNSRRTCKAQPCMATCQKIFLLWRGDIHLCPPLWLRACLQLRSRCLHASPRNRRHSSPPPAVKAWSRHQSLCFRLKSLTFERRCRR